MHVKISGDAANLSRHEITLYFGAGISPKKKLDSAKLKWFTDTWFEIRYHLCCQDDGHYYCITIMI